MRTLQPAEFLAILAAADVSHAGFARLSGVSARQVNKWCRGRTALPRWAGLLAIALRELSARHSQSCLKSYRMRVPTRLSRRRMTRGQSLHLKGKIAPSGRSRNDSHELKNATKT
jgi:transcriptional regulator with XRE-family HTH domain